MQIKKYLMASCIALCLAGCSGNESGNSKENDGDATEEKQDQLSPDDWINPAFAKVLEEDGYIEDASTVQPEDVANITELIVKHRDLISLQGIECFENLEILNCKSNSLKELDLSNNTKLKELYCKKNQIDRLDVSKCTALEVLSADKNELYELNLKRNRNLKVLNCGSNFLKGLDISNCIKLESLNCWGNPGENSVFTVTSWCDNMCMPEGFIRDSWEYGGNTVSINYVMK